MVAVVATIVPESKRTHAGQGSHLGTSASNTSPGMSAHFEAQRLWRWYGMHGPSVKQLACRLGEVLLLTEIAVREQPASILQTAMPMHFHTDTPAADLILWHCVQRGENDEFLLLIDLDPVFNSFSPSELRLLSKVRCRTPPEYNPPHEVLLRYGDYPLVRFEGEQPMLNFTPWLGLELDGDTHGSLLDRFLEALAEAKRSPKEVFLEPGDVLAIRNGRYLHSRTQLSASSKRCHFRYLIREIPQPASSLESSEL